MQNRSRYKPATGMASYVVFFFKNEAKDVKGFYYSSFIHCNNSDFPIG